MTTILQKKQIKHKEICYKDTHSITRRDVAQNAVVEAFGTATVNTADNGIARSVRERNSQDQEKT